ncbi:GvpL/GvpF family gas vesicle protein [Puniceicoccaceae bacterium K14]|nr:GvpL/GvpF family gas vesicle protein [Puniceicoccaceae bacterium K14]
MSIYIYGYTLADAPHDLEDIKGVDDCGLFMVTVGEVSAIVSSYDYERLIVKGKDIFAHQHVLQTLMSDSSLIPLQFGLTLNNLAVVESVLLRNQDVLTAQLKRLYRKVEMELKVRIDVDDILDYIIEKYPHMQGEKGKIVNGRLVSYLGDRLRKCEKFENLLKKEKDILSSQVREIVGPWCAEIKESKAIKMERDVVTYNCLVNRERLKVFEASIYEAGDKFKSELAFSFNGPWAPQNFCQLAKIEYA